jgi:hypothetical protein
MTESVRPRGSRFKSPAEQTTERLPCETAVQLIAFLSVLCWVVLIFIGMALWSAFG